MKVMTRQATAPIVSPDVAVASLIAATSLALAFGLRLVLDPLLGARQPYSSFYLAIAVTSWFAGLWPALVVTLGGYFVANWFFIEPRYVLRILHPTAREVVSAVLYLLVGVVIAGVTESLRRAERRADEKAGELAEKVRESAQRADEVQALFDAAPVAIWVAHDPACQRITGNRFADQVLAVPIGSNVSVSVPPDQRVPTAHPMKDGREVDPDELALYVAVRTGKPVVNSEVDLVFDDGRTISFTGGAVPVRDMNGRVRGAVAAMADVSAQKRAEERSAAARAEAEKARAEAEKAAETLRRVQRITDAMLGDLPPDKLLHEVLLRVQEALTTDVAILLVGKAKKDEEAVLRVRSIIGVPDVEIGSVAPGRGFGAAVATERRPKVWHDVDPGQMVPPVLRGVQLRSVAGVPLFLGEHLLGVLEVASLRPRNFTEEDVNLLRLAGERIALGIERAARQDAERHIRESLEASNRVKDEFLAMLGHELRNPLAAVRNAVAIAGVDEVGRAQALEIAGRQADQLGRLIDDLLDTARITQGRIALRKERVNLTEVIERAVDSVRGLVEERDVRLTVAQAPALPVEADPARLEQVFVNLLSNAAKYTDAGGRIDVTSERQGDEIVVHVCDTGIGIAPEMLSRIWDLFAQADRTLDRARGGLGIGLTLARRLVELHGGKIEAHSEGLGKGAEFVVRLPVSPVETGDSRPSAAPERPRPQRYARILLVEDNRDVAATLKKFLEVLGHRVCTVYDGVAAVDAARSTRPDVMLVDIGLPKMDGYEVARRVRRDPDLSQVVLVALSGYGREEDKERAMTAGFDYHLVKPVDPKELDGLVARFGGVDPAKPTLH